MQLKRLLYSDLERQYSSEEPVQQSATLLKLLARLFHPRFLPIVFYRLARAARLKGIPGIPQLLSYANIVLFGLEIPAQCEIGPGLFLPHTTGTVVGAWRIGANVTIFQGVTLGAKNADMGFGVALRPEVGNNVTLGAGCKVLGGIRVGDDVTVGANAVVLESVPDNVTVAGIPARIVRRSVEGLVACN
jgi:serine O-acetyltransferase